MIQEHALRCLPLLVSDATVGERGIEVLACALSPFGLTEDTRFFINGQPFDEVEYPIVAPGLEELFFAVPWAGTRARAPFFRIDASPTGVFMPHHWRQAMHIANPLMERYPLPGQLEPFFQVVSIVDTLAIPQDLVVMRRRPLPSSASR